MSDGIVLKWTVPLPTLGEQVHEKAERLMATLGKLGQVIVAQLVTDTKATAPWADRTSNARQTLHGRALLTASFLQLILSHGVDYGIWLEVKNGGRFGIVVKTMKAQAPRIFAMVRALFGA